MKEECIRRLQQLIHDLGYVPSYHEARRKGRLYHKTWSKFFADYKQFLQAAGIIIEDPKTRIKLCRRCGAEFTPHKHTQRYCTNSCAKYKHGENTVRLCLECDAKCVSKSGYCSTLCSMLNRNKSRTLAQVINKDRHASKYAAVRSNARNLLKHVREAQCQVCQYATFVEVCHLKAISTFHDSAQLSVVNDPSNLVYLCPTHHREQEAGLLDL